MEEVWKDIEGYIGKYQISNMGNVRSLNYNNTKKVGLLKPKVNKYGYLEVKLSINNKTKNFLVSTLVGKAFIPNNNPDKMIVHISEDVTDNRVSNLKWAYQSEMLHDTYKRGRRKGTPSKNAISYKGFATNKRAKLARKFGLSPKQLGHRLNKGWTLEESLEIPMHKLKGGGAKVYDYYGELKTLEQISNITGNDKELIRKRLSRGWNIYEASEIPKLRK